MTADTHGERRRAAILAAGVQSWPDVTARNIGRRVGLTHAAVLYHFGTVAALREAVAAEAVRVGDTRVVLQLIALKHPAADTLSSDQRRAYLAAI